MAEPWITIAPVRNLWRVPDGTALPLRLGPHVQLVATPEWMYRGGTPTWNILLEHVHKALREEDSQFSLQMKYNADALGSPDPKWKGKQPRAIQQTASEHIRDVMLAFWLVRPTSVTFHEVFHAAHGEPEWLVRSVDKFSRLCALPSYIDDAYSAEELARVNVLATAIDGVKPGDSLFPQIQVVVRALTERDWVMRFLLLWLVMEALFGPDDGREITYRLSLRAALFLGHNVDEQRSLLAAVKKNYRWRSKVVHGLRLAGLEAEESDRLIVELEDVVRRALSKILASPDLMTAFNSKSRDEYLDAQVFHNK